MNILRLTNQYEIITDMESNIKVQKFANAHCAEHTPIDLRVNGSLFDDGDRLVTIKFKSKEKRKDVYAALREEFKCYNLRFGKVLVFI